MTFVPFTVLEDEGPGFPVESRDTASDLPPPGCRETILPLAPLTMPPADEYE